MKAAYARPTLVEYGTMTSLTQGASGDKPDFNVVNNVLVPDINNPTCTTNGPPLCGIGGGGTSQGGSLSEIPL